MRIQAGVKSIAMGGRPQSGPIQGVGGIKGAEIFAWSDIYSYAQGALPYADASQAASLNRISDLPINRSSSNGINIRDNILPNNLNDGLPAQFVIEEADCKLWWTAPMITDVTAVWKAAANAAFNGGSCAAGGIAKRGINRNSATIRKAAPLNKSKLSMVKRDLSAVKSDSWAARHLVKAIP
jgi:hypothetical protein